MLKGRKDVAPGSWIIDQDHPRDRDAAKGIERHEPLPGWRVHQCGILPEARAEEHTSGSTLCRVTCRPYFPQQRTFSRSAFPCLRFHKNSSLERAKPSR